jgi:hypothetical protein
MWLRVPVFGILTSTVKGIGKSMTTSVRQKTLGILADSVSEVVGQRSLVYIAVRQAAISGEPEKERWADSLFQQVSLSSRRQIRSTAIEKAAIEASNDKAKAVAVKKDDGQAVVADLQKLFGGSRPSF